MSCSKYVVLDGMDGSGKGTQITLLEKYFGDRVVFVREPGGTPFAEKIRKLVRDDPLAAMSTPLNNFLLFWAAREDLQHQVVQPALKAGKHVLSDRGYSSTWAYQIYGEEQRALKNLFLALRAEMFQGEGRWQPDLHVVYDLPAEVARARVMRDHTRERNHFDNRPLAYYKRVRDGFNALRQANEEVCFINAEQTPEAMHLQTLAALQSIGIE